MLESVTLCMGQAVERERRVKTWRGWVMIQIYRTKLGKPIGEGNESAKIQFHLVARESIQRFSTFLKKN